MKNIKNYVGAGLIFLGGLGFLGGNDSYGQNSKRPLFNDETDTLITLNETYDILNNDAVKIKTLKEIIGYTGEKKGTMFAEYIQDKEATLDFYDNNQNNYLRTYIKFNDSDSTDIFGEIKCDCFADGTIDATGTETIDAMILFDKNSNSFYYQEVGEIGEASTINAIIKYCDKLK